MQITISPATPEIAEQLATDGVKFTFDDVIRVDVEESNKIVWSHLPVVESTEMVEKDVSHEMDDFSTTVCSSIHFELKV